MQYHNYTPKSQLSTADTTYQTLLSGRSPNRAVVYTDTPVLCVCIILQLAREQTQIIGN